MFSNITKGPLGSLTYHKKLFSTEIDTPREKFATDSLEVCYSSKVVNYNR